MNDGDAEQLATMVSTVTRTMLGITFEVNAHPAPPAQDDWRTATLEVPGKRRVTIELAADEASSTALSAAMFSVPHSSVDETMVDDSLRELLTMTASVLKRDPWLDPRLRSPDAPPLKVMLKAKSLRLYVEVCER